MSINKLDLIIERLDKVIEILIKQTNNNIEFVENQLGGNK